MRHPDAAGSLEVLTEGADGTRTLAAALGSLLRVGDLVLLEGELGAGKTVFVQGLAKGLGHDAMVKSPTFTLLHEYGRNAASTARARLAHLDLYRIPAGRELTDLALDELLDRAAVAVEWGGRLAEAYPDHIRVTLEQPEPTSPERRRVALRGQGARGKALVASLADALRARAGSA